VAEPLRNVKASGRQFAGLCGPTIARHDGGQIGQASAIGRLGGPPSGQPLGREPSLALLVRFVHRCIASHDATPIK
jgi:hypothetical protein